MENFTKMRTTPLQKQARLFYMSLFIFLLAFGNLNAQVTPPNANTDAECGPDCWDLFSWSTVQDGSGNNIPNFSEGLASDANCNTTIDATAEYTGADSNGPDLVGTSIGANLQGTSTDQWVIGFGAALTDPVINFSALETTSDVLITDCEGNEITATCISSCGANLAFTPGVGWSGDVAYSLQLSGTYDCINISVAVINNDAYNFSIGTCLGAAPFPPCVNCGPNEDFEYINLVNKMGSGTGATADVELDNVLVGSAEVLFSDLDINEDLSGTTFGGFDNDGGTYLLRLQFCEPITIQQFDIKNLEVESQVSIGTTISGMGASATLGGATLTQCAGSNRMTLNDGAPNLVITDGPGCGANPNASYTLGNITTDVLYFKYQNPVGGCSFDYVGFKIGTCIPDGADAVPVCPLTYVTYTTDIVDYVTNGPDFVGNDANAFQVMRDANGNFFNQNCTQIENEVNNSIAIPTVAISPCAEVVEEEDCSFCTPAPPCNACPAGSENELISLDKTGETADGRDIGIVEIDGVCIGQYEFEFDDLDVNTDGNGTQFGGFDNDGGTLILRIDFCDPLMVNQLDVRNLEVESQVSVGTTITGMGASAVLGGQTLTFCDGSSRMDQDDITNGNLITTAGPGCGANPNASYTFGTNPVSTLYFKYHNPVGGCSYDYVGFKIGTCVTPPPMAVPVCPFETVKVTCDMDAVIDNNGVANNSNSDTYVVDGAGNYFDYTNCNATALMNAYENGTMLQTVNIGCAELVEIVDECIPADCIIAPTCAATSCPTDFNIDRISLDQSGTNASGLDIGDIQLNGACVGTYEFLFSDLDVSEDGNGTTFGGWDNDGGTMLLRLDFCEPIEISELDIRNLEVGSEVSIGTTISGMGASAVLGGQTLINCSDPSGRMGVGPAPNEVITDGPGCGANPNATYTVGTNPVTTLYFKYHNPPSDGTFPSRCRGDYVGFRIKACVPDLPEAIPTCPLTLFESTTTKANGTVITETLMQDVNGNYFAVSGCPTVEPTSPSPTIEVSPCATLVQTEICSVCCTPSITCPNPGTFDCGDDAGINAWLASYMAEVCTLTGTTVTTDYDPADFDKCETTTENIRFSLRDASGAVIADCVTSLTINAAPAPTPAAIVFVPELSCADGDAFVAPALPYTNNLTGDCNISGTIAPSVQNNFDACGGQIVINYNGQDECGNTLSAGPFTINVLPAPTPDVTLPTIPLSISCEEAINFMADDATYTNGLTGVCNISGNIPGVVIPFFDACGGFLRIKYEANDACGTDISVPDTTIQVKPAPIPTITSPALPSSLTCEEAANFIPPVGTYDNGAAGICNLSGTATYLVNNFFDACGGTMQVVYLAEDACGRSIPKNVEIIDVEPAPAPTIQLPNFPSSVSCAEAADYEAPVVSYDNGLMGICNISGLSDPQVSYDVDANAGGTLTIDYSATDACGNEVSSASVVIQVEPASLPELKGPAIVPATIYCWDAATGYYPGNATYTNGETGFCENSGEIVGVVTEFWNSCDGGYILYDYSGTDAYGNELTPLVIKVSVLPDTWAPDGGCAPYAETMTSIQDVPEPDELDYYFDQVAAGYYEACSEVVVSVVGDTGAPECDGNGYFSRIYTVEIADACGNVAGECSITFSGSCSQYICTMDQKFYGNPDEEMNGQSSGQILEALLDNGANPIVIGDGVDCGFIIDDMTCVQAMLNSYGAAVSLPAGYSTDCFDTNNSLINQIVVTTLNVRYNEMMNPSGNINYGGLLLADACLNIPGFILANLPANPTVNDLLAYANEFIACQCDGSCGAFQPNMAELTNLFWGINSRYNKCHIPGPCQLDVKGNGPTIFVPTNEVKNTTFDLYPNPTDEWVNIKLYDSYGKSCVVEIFNARGQKVGEQSYQDLDQDVLQIDVQEYSAGVHWMMITVDGQDQMTKRFMVIK